MSDWPVGLSTGCFYHTNILDCLETIHNSGFSMIEVCSFPAHLDYHDSTRVREAARRIDELGMEPYSFHAPFADHIDITALDRDCRNQGPAGDSPRSGSGRDSGSAPFCDSPGSGEDLLPPGGGTFPAPGECCSRAKSGCQTLS